jgi:hypothetical protein
MNEKGVDLDGALDWVAESHEQVLSELQVQCQVLPSWGPTIDLRVKMYVKRLACFLRGSDCWAFETERYFGTKGREIQKQRIIDLLPKAEVVAPIMMAPSQDFRGLNLPRIAHRIGPLFPLHIAHLIVWTVLCLIAVKTLSVLLYLSAP